MKLAGIPAQVLGLLFVTRTIAYWRMDCPGIISEGRLDPIVTPGQISGHAHVTFGGNGFHPDMDYDSTQRSTCTTCTIKGDNSNYWISSLYFYAQNGTFYKVPIFGGAIYYQQRATYPNKTVQAFPKGFRMTAGNPERRFYNATRAQEAISHHCLNYDGEEPMKETAPLPSVNCPSGIRAQVYFPSCWDGEHLDMPNHQDHMAYPIDAYNRGRCPDTHPNPLVSIFYEFFFATDKFSDEWDADNGDPQPFVYSTGDDTGYGLHGDFVNGWDIPTLQNGIDKKTSEDAGCATNVLCDGIFEYPDVYGEDCRLPKLVDEDINGPLNALPGCNPINENDPPSPNCKGAAEFGIVYNDIFTDVTESHKYAYLGCSADPVQRTLEKKVAASNDMTVEKCVELCKKRHYIYAGLEYSSECFCGNKLDPVGIPKPDSVGNCDMRCSGNKTQKCGDGGRLSLYKRCKSNKKCKNVEYELPGAPGARVKRDYELEMFDEDLNSTTNGTVY